MDTSLSLIGVFFAGVLTFVSPCIMPLMPMYLSYMTGQSIEEGNVSKKTIALSSFGFIMGLMIVFGLFGLTATTVGRFFHSYSDIFRKLSGVVIVLFGLHHGGFITIGKLVKEKKVLFKSRGKGIWNSVLLGIAFSFGWTPCVGPILGSILILSANTATIGSGIWMLVIYTLGFSIPFLITALFLNEIINRLPNFEKHFITVKRVTGILMIAMGVLVFMNLIGKITALFIF